MKQDVDFLIETSFKGAPDNIVVDVKNMWTSLCILDLERVVELFERIVEKYPIWAQLHYDIITFLTIYGNPDWYGNAKALLVSFAKAEQKRPMSAIFKYGLGYIYQTKHFHDGAFDKFEKASKLRKNFSPAYYAMATVFQAKKDSKKVIDFCTKAIKIDSMFAEPHYALGVVYMSNKEMGKAFHHFSKFLEIATPYLEKYKNEAESCSNLIQLHMRHC